MRTIYQFSVADNHTVSRATTRAEALPSVLPVCVPYRQLSMFQQELYAFKGKTVDDLQAENVAIACIAAVVDTCQVA